MSRFKIGDLVVVVGGREEAHPPNKGKVGRVTGVEESNDSIERRHQVWVDGDCGYFDADLDLMESADGSAPKRPVYFVATTAGGAQFKSADFDPSDPEDLALLLEFRSQSLEGDIAFESSQGNEVNIPKGRLDNLIWYNIPTD